MTTSEMPLFESDSPPSRVANWLASWKLWLAMLFVAIGLAAITICIPIYRRMQALDYLAAHNISCTLSEDSPSVTERFGRWGRGFRRVDSIAILEIEEEETLRHIAVLRELKRFYCERTVPLSEDSIESLASLTQVETISLGDERFRDELLYRWFSRRPPLRFVRLHSPLSQRMLCELSRIPTLESLVLRESGLADVDFRNLDALPNLHTLSLHGCEIGPHAGSWVSAMPALSEIQLDEVQVANDFWPHLAGMPQLNYVLIENATLSAEALQSLSLAPQIVDLRIEWSTLDGAGLEHIGRMHRLERLSLEGCTGMTDDDVRHLAQLPSLKHLNLEGCNQLTEGCVVHLEGHPQLSTLLLPPAAVTGSSVESMSTMPNLGTTGVEFYAAPEELPRRR